jgi:drug/metabolite transporter superfamily protein YnfA
LLFDRACSGAPAISKFSSAWLETVVPAGVPRAYVVYGSSIASNATRTGPARPRWAQNTGVFVLFSLFLSTFVNNSTLASDPG